jgi:hypothetical protein
MTLNAGVREPDEALYAEMGRFVDEMSRAGVLSFALIETASKDEAIEISRRFWAIQGDGEGDIRQVYGPE